MPPPPGPTPPPMPIGRSPPPKNWTIAGNLDGQDTYNWRPIVQALGQHFKEERIDITEVIYYFDPENTDLENSNAENDLVERFVQNEKSLPCIIDSEKKDQRIGGQLHSVSILLQATKKTERIEFDDLTNRLWKKVSAEHGDDDTFASPVNQPILFLRLTYNLNLKLIYNYNPLLLQRSPRAINQ
ncbi:hypothetical protein CONLIGDRAFT_676471 [Coniochaeta ligniaria NRRL 30616]|uniref:Uncharacterized protein n=1 Tax=Coniochaeta ligniaria NRRL 30616 TaxID=1408157 RepID=A0A1J7K1H0_9PEZI|nr:hypothetical protein CONLIGDRAFT_676471 [Coniochaeta ligniaria NRRL 30616]